MGAIEFHHTLTQANSLTELTVSVAPAPMCSRPQCNSFTVESVTTIRQLRSTKRAELVHTMPMQLLKALVADEVLTWKSHRIVQQEAVKTNRTLVTLFDICSRHCSCFQSAEVKCGCCSCNAVYFHVSKIVGTNKKKGLRHKKPVTSTWASS